MLISSHILDELSRLATHYGIIDGGRMVKELSAEELEAACRKCMRVEVTDVKALVRILDEMKIEYKILSDTQADVFAKVNISGIFVYGKLSEPEFASQMVMNEQGSFDLAENIPNNGYLTGVVRTVFDWLDMPLPSSQGMHIMHGEGAFDIRMPVCSVAVAGVLVYMGIIIFKKKDIR